MNKIKKGSWVKFNKGKIDGLLKVIKVEKVPTYINNELVMEEKIYLVYYLSTTVIITNDKDTLFNVSDKEAEKSMKYMERKLMNVNGKDNVLSKQESDEGLEMYKKIWYNTINDYE